jgi:D-arabinose 5-phosphate isomerase GutQ
MIHQENVEPSMTQDDGPSQDSGSLPELIGKLIAKTGTCYINYLDTTLGCVLEQQDKIGHLCRLIESSQQVHVYGFGRSGSAALSLAIRLRHFCDYLPVVWWMGDEVRQPVREHDLVILFSGSGQRTEVELVAQNAKKSGAVIVLISGEDNSRIGQLASLIIRLPKMKDPVSYGGGDFELAAYFFQEFLVTILGQYREIPADVVGKNHV